MDEHDGVSRYPLPRRGFVMTGLIAGFTTATGHGALAQRIWTGSEGLSAGEVRIPVSDGVLPGYAARPAGSGPVPVVVVIEEIFGVHEYIRDVCRRLAHAGYLAVAPELYARLADLSRMSDPREIVREVIDRAPDATVLSDLDATVRWAGTSGGDANRVGTIGFCRGGRDAWLFAEHAAVLKAAVAFYGPVNSARTAIQPRAPLDAAAELKCPLLGLYGALDDSISQDDVAAAALRARDAGRTVEIHVYADAPHGFHADYRPSYRAADAADGWRRALDWLRRHGV